MSGHLEDALTRCRLEWRFGEPCKTGEYLSADAHIEFPDGAIELKHGDETITVVELPDIEIVTNEAGVALYLTIGPSAYGRILEIIGQKEEEEE